MGGKTKQTQRTKNNAKPSNSGRSAELLGTSVPAFVGFSAHSDLGMVPFAPGFLTAENLPETFDSSISTQFQLVLRKMSKKDPITKGKAMHEFIDLLNESDVDVVKGILPLWPKFYHNLANDVDHRVRESAQNVQNLIVSKCKKAVAPYIKQLTPVWLGSQFDNYPPAASVAASSFQSVFAANKMQEVCLFCQQEILDYVMRNLTFHTASTLTSAKSCTPEEAEHKYHRVIVSSLKILSFFLEKTAGNDISSSSEKIHSLLLHPKFWSFAKHKTAHIKAAWFELLYNVLQYTPELTKEIKGQLITICFQNIDDSDPLTVPHIWGCILLLQNTYDDWYKAIDLKKNVQTKLSTYLRNDCNGNAETVCPNLLPFLSKLTQENLQDVSLDAFFKDLFNAMKEAITTEKTISKSDVSSLTAAFYECIRYIVQRYNTNVYSNTELPQYILHEFINHPVKWGCRSSGSATKYIFKHTSALIAYWSGQSDSKLYAQLLNEFWSSITEEIKKEPLNDTIVDNTTDLINSLYWANPNLENHKVKFSTNNDVDAGRRQKSRSQPLYVQVELRNFTVIFVRLCLDCISKEMTLKYETQVRNITKLYSDARFYAEISDKNDLEVTLNLLADILCGAALAPSEIVVEMVFEMLNFLEKEKRMEFINKLLETKKTVLQQCILQRLLSYPMCIEPEVRVMLSNDSVIEIILQTASEVLIDNSKDKFNLLHKCFFQTDTGEILINQKTVDGILNIMSKPLTNPEEYDAMMDQCGRFISQIMPVVCSNNSTELAQKDVFLKLFQFTIVQKESDDLSQDTLWEITSCWQDALSSKDIIMDDVLLHDCAQIVSMSLPKFNLLKDINNTADIISKLILCSTENIEDEVKRYNVVDSYVEVLLKPENEKFKQNCDKVANMCTYLEILQDKVSVTELSDGAGEDIQFDIFLARSFLNLDTLTKMFVNLNSDSSPDNEDYIDVNETLLTKWTDKMYGIAMELIKVGSMAESLVTNCITATKNQIEIMLAISEMATNLLKAIDEDHSIQIKDRLLKDAAFNDLAATRAIPFLIAIPQYAQFQESALILLQEDLTEYLITREAISTYVNLLQYTTPGLSSKAINSDNPILGRDADIWQKCVTLRCLIENNFNVDKNDIADKKIIAITLNYITEVSEKQKQSEKEALLYNTDVTKQDFQTLTRVVEYMKLLNVILKRFPYELTIKHWDAIRIGLSSWVLSVSKSVDNYTNSKVSIFVNSVYNLYAQLATFISNEKSKSSTEVLSNMIDEWENLFSPEVCLVLFKSFYKYVSLNETKDSTYLTSYATTMQEMALCVQRLDFSVIYASCKNGKNITLNELTKFLLNNISSPLNNLRKVSAIILVTLAPFFIANDKEIFEKSTDIVDTKASSSAHWHYMSNFQEQLAKYEGAILKYLKEFSFKLTELPEMRSIDRSDAQPYFLLWDVIMRVCSKAPVELRSVYTSWLTENNFDENFLNFMFRAMPVEILKNHDSKLMGNELFNVLNWTEWESKNEMSIDKYACYLYTMALSKLPAVVRKWWNSSHSRQKVFVDKLTTNFVSALICFDELESIAKINMKEKHNNMQVAVHTSTREVNAVYFIDEARMELIITLAPNYPLGGVKVESGKQIGGRASSRNIAMQLTIFLTHQNGSIFDGLSLWKKNLDKKFEGVEECYICYTVIHQDTCQLPKLTCKTCRKKFHSPCLYKWFTTSSKSTCPICRNIF